MTNFFSLSLFLCSSRFSVNFLQMVSLAGGLPLQWPDALQVMFDSFSTVSSAGTTLMNPDCELTSIRTVEAFYLKQIVYTFSVPMIVFVCIIIWTIIKCCCQKRMKLNSDKIKDHTVLSIVLMLFLCYPMLVKKSLSMLKCPFVGEVKYLLADLQEPCFIGNHLHYFLLLTVPQIVLYVVGLPFMATLIIVRNKQKLHQDKRFSTRYSLLYMGYRKGREWWEVVIVMRKVAVVSIGTFGTVMGVVDLQAFLALGIVFISIVTHLAFQPFDVNTKNGKMLHQLEFIALCVAWFTFWGGLLYFIGHEKSGSVHKNVLFVTTILLVLANSTFLLYSISSFVREYLKDRKTAEKRDEKNKKNKSQVVPIDKENEGVKEWKE